MKVFIASAILFAWMLPLPGQNQVDMDSKTSAPLKVTKISGGITFDGVPDEAVWQSVPNLPLVMLLPVSGIEPSELSIVKIAYDDDYFYASGWLMHQNPDNIRAVGKKRDYSSASSDWFGFILDTFNDRENAVSFHTNPNGLRTDGTVKNDALDPNEDISFSWNTFWDVKTVISQQGWSAEFRIPFSSLRFQTYQGRTLMGILFWRYDAAKNECSTWPMVSPHFTEPYWKPSQCSLIEFQGLEPENPLYVTPYVTTGFEQLNELNETGTEYQLDSTPKFDMGLDAKYSLTPNLTSDLTINTDFAQVEADDQKINLTRFSLYFPEKRIFFLEKADVFDFSFLGGNNLFYSRRIGLYEGNPVRIYGGLRMTGRAGDWDIGFLDMQTASFEKNPGENFGVFRTKRKVFNVNSFAGGMVTSKLGTNGSYNVAYGLDGLFRVIGDDYLTLKWAQTFEKDSANTFMDLDPSRILVEWLHRKQTGFGYDFVYTWSGRSFNPGIGFEVKQNYQGPRIIFQYGWLPQSDTFLRYHNITLTGYNFTNTATETQETTIGILQWNFEAKKGFWGNVAVNWFLENLQDELALGNDQATVPPGKYPFCYLSALYSTASTHSFSAQVTTEAGTFYDGWKFSFYLNPRAKIGTGFDMELTYQLDRIEFSSRSMDFTNHIVGCKGLMTLTAKTSLSAFVQYNTAIEQMISNVRFRFNPREGNDLYLVYDEADNTRLSRAFPTLPRCYSRTILLKYTYTFRL